MILQEVNKEKVKSNVTGIMVEPKKMIGGVTNKDGKVVSAKVQKKTDKTCSVSVIVITGAADQMDWEGEHNSSKTGRHFRVGEVLFRVSQVRALPFLILAIIVVGQSHYYNYFCHPIAWLQGKWLIRQPLNGKRPCEISFLITGSSFNISIYFTPRPFPGHPCLLVSPVTLMWPEVTLTLPPTQSLMTPS